MNFKIRIAELNELDSIENLMKRSMNALGMGHYSKEQVASCCQFVCVPDQQLIKDKTFFVVESADGTLIGCGGWSFRKKLYAGPDNNHQLDNRLDPLSDSARIRAMFVDPDYSGKGIGSLILDHSEKAAKDYGFTKGSLGSTVSGLSFYKAKGWKETSEEKAVLPDGVSIRVVQMEKNLHTNHQ
ncbi:MAG: GNAT family N-acetyltransferase [Chlamydiales bacterium]|nr:GNAT family N-acetyltransferase [Chlamydiales bacterium]